MDRLHEAPRGLQLWPCGVVDVLIKLNQGGQFCHCWNYFLHRLHTALQESHLGYKEAKLIKPIVSQFKTASRSHQFCLVPISRQATACPACLRALQPRQMMDSKLKKYWILTRPPSVGRQSPEVLEILLSTIRAHMNWEAAWLNVAPALAFHNPAASFSSCFLVVLMKVEGNRILHLPSDLLEKASKNQTSKGDFCGIDLNAIESEVFSPCTVDPSPSS